MNQNIKAAAIEYNLGEDDDTLYEEGILTFLAGATYFQQSSGADEMAEALAVLMQIDFHDQPTILKGMAIGVDTMQLIRAKAKADGALAKYNSFIKKEEDGK